MQNEDFADRLNLSSKLAQKKQIRSFEELLIRLLIGDLLQVHQNVAQI